MALNRPGRARTVQEEDLEEGPRVLEIEERAASVERHDLLPGQHHPGQHHPRPPERVRRDREQILREGLEGLWVYEGALSFVTKICSSNRESPYKMRMGRQNDKRPSSKPARDVTRGNFVTAPLALRPKDARTTVM
jgi:hypothetical protein